MALEPQELIIVRRRGDEMDTTPKSGVWKIAYADFATAMMAFFLLMWLVNASDEASQKGIASYFNPIKLVDSSVNPKGVRDPDEEFAPDEADEGVDAGKPIGEGGTEQSGPTTGGGIDKPEPVSDEESGENSEHSGVDGEKASEESTALAMAAAERQARYTEAQLFDNPYAILAALAAEAEAIINTDGSPGTGGLGALEMAKTPVLFALPIRDPDGQGLADGTSFRDPFDPAGWQKDELPGNAPLLARIPVLSKDEEGISSDELTDEQIKLLESTAELARGGKKLPVLTGEADAEQTVIVVGDAPEKNGESFAEGEIMEKLAQSEAEHSGKEAVMTRLVFAEAHIDPSKSKAETTDTLEDKKAPSTSSLQPIGDEEGENAFVEPEVFKDLVRITKAPLEKPQIKPNTEVSQKQEVAVEEKLSSQERKLISLANKVGEALDGVKTGASIEFAKSADGVLIQIMDNEKFGMFAVGSSEPHPDVVRAMGQIAKALKEEGGEVVIRGHTDARPFKSRTNDNWRLSTARAHMAYYMLVRGGLDEKRIVGIEGYADRRLKDAVDPYAPQNRRIEIMLMKEKV